MHFKTVTFTGQFTISFQTDGLITNALEAQEYQTKDTKQIQAYCYCN